MKKLNKCWRLPIMILMTIALTAGVASADITTYTALLLGSAEVPPVDTPAVGEAILIRDSDIMGFRVLVNFAGLSSAQTTAYIHGGDSSSNGPVLYELPLGDDVEAFFPFDGLIEVIIFAEYLVNDSLYVNISSENYPDGEIRGLFTFANTVESQDATWEGVKALYR